MALPFLALGLGLLGGKAYLQNKEDTRNSNSLLSEMEGFLSNNQEFAAANPQYQASMDTLRANQGFMTDDAEMAQSLMTRMRADDQLQTARAEKVRAEQAAASNQFDQDWARDVGQFAEVVQPSFQKALLALENPNSADSVSALYNFFNIIEPGGRVTENEDGSFRGIGGSGGRISNWLNEMRGDGLSDVTRDQIIDALWNQYTPEYERASRQKLYYEQMLDASRGMYGEGVQSPIGRQGIEWGNQDPRGASQVQPPSSDPQPPVGWRFKDED